MLLEDAAPFYGRLVEITTRSGKYYGIPIDLAEMIVNSVSLRGMQSHILWAYWTDTLQSAVDSYEDLKQEDFKPITENGKLVYVDLNKIQSFKNVDWPHEKWVATIFGA